MSLNTKLILTLIIALNANHILTMERPTPLSEADERAAGSRRQYDPRPEATESKPSGGRSASPTTQQRKAEQAEKAQQEQNQRQRAAQEESNGPRAHIYGATTINNFTKPVLVMGEQLRDPNAGNPSIEEENARREGELRGMRAVDEEKAFIRAQSNPEAIRTREEYNKLQARWNAQKAIDTHRIVTQHKLSDESFERNRTLAARDGITNAISSLAVKEYLRNHDYDQTFRGKFIFLAKEVAVRLAIEALVDVAKQGGSFCKSKLYQAYINLPFAHCRNLKDQEEMIAQFNTIQAKIQMLRAEKRDLQEILDHDALLLKKEEDNIRYFKKRAKETQDEKEKEHLQNVVEVLQQQHEDNRLKYAMLLKLNANQQPHFQRVMAENQRKMQQQKAREAQSAGA